MAHLANERVGIFSKLYLSVVETLPNGSVNSTLKDILDLLEGKGELSNSWTGSDSLGGFFTELGPFIANAFDDGQTLRRNPFTWNLVSNVLYLTHPTGVGYSYRGDDENSHTDESDAIDNAEFLRKFFAAYPEFAENDFWLTGESYAGICKRNRHCPADRR